MRTDKTDEYDSRPSNRTIVQTELGKFEAQDKPAPDWKPSEAAIEMLRNAYACAHQPSFNRIYATGVLMAVGDLIIAEEKPKIERAERERMAKYFATIQKWVKFSPQEIVDYLRADRDKQP